MGFHRKQSRDSHKLESSFLPNLKGLAINICTWFSLASRCDVIDVGSPAWGRDRQLGMEASGGDDGERLRARLPLSCLVAHSLITAPVPVPATSLTRSAPSMRKLKICQGNHCSVVERSRIAVRCLLARRKPISAAVACHLHL